MKRLIVLVLLGFAGIASPMRAADQINYTSQPDELAVFFNDIAYARDVVMLPGGVDVQVVLPAQVFADTVVVREGDARIPGYRISRNNDGQLILHWLSPSSLAVREATIEYLMSGVGWSPKYEMWLGANDAETVQFDFYVQIRNPSLTLDDVDVRLVAGRVDTAQQLGDVSRVTANQYLAGYEESEPTQSLTGTATVQHVYDIGSVSAEPGETIYWKLQENELPARRLHLWNAQTDQQVTVIYKVRNESQMPLAEGIVRTYQNDLFLGSDFVELTPVGSEGSITVGNLQNVRVNRSESRTNVDGPSDRDTLHEVVLSLSNFGDEAAEIEVVDRYSPDALEFQFSHEPSREGDNVLRWVVTVESGATEEIRYSFKD